MTSEISSREKPRDFSSITNNETDDVIVISSNATFSIFCKYLEKQKYLDALQDLSELFYPL